MNTDFTVITEDFVRDLEAMRSLVNAFKDPHATTAKARIAAANSATLLLAATFEEYVRQMARAYARAVVTATASFDNLPPKLASTAWRRTMETLARINIDNKSKSLQQEKIFSDALMRFDVVFKFCKGDLSQDIYRELIYNQNNLRPNEINSLFKVSNLQDVCSKLSDKKPILDVFGEAEARKAHGKLLASLEEFFKRRNEIAHALNLARSSGSNDLLNDVDIFEAFASSLCETLQSQVAGTQSIEVDSLAEASGISVQSD